MLKNNQLKILFTSLALLACSATPVIAVGGAHSSKATCLEGSLFPHELSAHELSAHDRAELGKNAREYPSHNVLYTYGTAGFRMKATMLDPVMFRMGVLAALRSKKLEGQTIGVMITASHNPAEDNGVKLVDPMGEMLDQTWEEYATQLANASTEDELLSAVESIVQSESIDLTRPAHVILGRDTRPSGEAFAAALIKGVTSLSGAFAKNYNVLSTPQLHYLTRALNTEGNPEAYYGEPSEKGYYKKLALAFQEWMLGTDAVLTPLYIDGANGVGAIKTLEFLAELETHTQGVKLLNAKIYNGDVDDP